MGNSRRKTDFPGGEESIAWFREFIGDTWEKLNHPCSRKVMERAFSYLKSREDAMNPAKKGANISTR